MNPSPYLIPKQPAIYEEEIKKSHFITYLAHTPSIESAKAFVEQIKMKHQDARHNCWAFVAGRPTDSMLWGFSDDGEPSGTAGKPILAQLTGSGVGEITAVVTRYYGGIRLGTGGLVKAYGGGVQHALKQLVTVEKIITSSLRLRFEYSFMPLVQSLMSQLEVKENMAHYSDIVDIIVDIDARCVDEFTQAIINKSGARVTVESLKEI
ncbi:YigZ family protein [Vibrio sp. SM6]|uniref:YigZ family protein n=1 Tax=Vibrio agarilyticus TaxID=2726741 RepID=A0A7X8YI69_9VIBR|nr:YigZ family protein [Vibrio agarilyticus]NLS14305.1 YigZ family protein [Vibrio agarilyticus]